MNRPPMSRPALALHRQLLGLAGAQANRIFLSGWTSTDWQSPTFSGERHRISFVVSGEEPLSFSREWLDGVEDREFDVPGGFLAEIASAGPLTLRDDGAALVKLEALTLED